MPTCRHVTCEAWIVMEMWISSVGAIHMTGVLFKDRGPFACPSPRTCALPSREPSVVGPAPTGPGEVGSLRGRLIIGSRGIVSLRRCAHPPGIGSEVRHPLKVGNQIMARKPTKR